MSQASAGKANVMLSYTRLSTKVTKLSTRSKSEGSVVSRYSVICQAKWMLIFCQVLKEMTTERQSPLMNEENQENAGKRSAGDVSKSVKALVRATMAEELAKVKEGSGLG